MCLIRENDIYSDDKILSPDLIRKILALAYLQTSTLPGSDWATPTTLPLWR